MSNILRKLNRHSGPSEPPVLIVRPHNPEGLTCERSHHFITFNFGNRIAQSYSAKSKAPELVRNKAIEDFLTDRKFKRKTHVFFLDDDSAPLEDDVIIKLLRHQLPVVCVPTPILRYNETEQHFVLYWNTEAIQEGHTEDQPKTKLYGVDYLPRRLFKCYRTGGTGLLIHREVLARLKPPYQKTTYNETVTGVLKSEDIYFCDKIRKAGYDIWADGTTVCHHYHRLDILDIMAMVKSIQLDKDRDKDPFLQDLLQYRLKQHVK